jgi:hypothetical protein
MPSPVLLTDSELEDLCNYLSALTYIYYPIATDYFHDIYVTGCRPKELVSITRWTYIDSSNVTLIPLKGNSIRYFNATTLSASFVYAIQNQIEPYNGLTIRQLSSVLKKILPVPQVTAPEKSAIDYMFRYNRVKQYAIAGYTDPAIQAIFGWSSALLATGYRTANVFASEPLPPLVYNGITDEFSNLLIDADGTFINY